METVQHQGLKVPGMAGGDPFFQESDQSVGHPEDFLEVLFGYFGVFNFSWEVEGFSGELEIPGVDDNGSSNEPPGWDWDWKAEWKADQHLEQRDTILPGLVDEVANGDVIGIDIVQIKNIEESGGKRLFMGDPAGGFFILIFSFHDQSIFNRFSGSIPNPVGQEVSGCGQPTTK